MTLRPMRILVVGAAGDAAVAREPAGANAGGTLVADVLAHDGHHVTVAPHVGAAINLIRQAPPSVILLDEQMPAPERWAFTCAYEQVGGPSAPIISFSTAASTAATTRDGVAASNGEAHGAHGAHGEVCRMMGHKLDRNEILQLVDSCARWTMA